MGENNVSGCQFVSRGTLMAAGDWSTGDKTVIARWSVLWSQRHIQYYFNANSGTPFMWTLHLYGSLPNLYEILSLPLSPIRSQLRFWSPNIPLTHCCFCFFYFFYYYYYFFCLFVSFQLYMCYSYFLYCVCFGDHLIQPFVYLSFWSLDKIYIWPTFNKDDTWELIQEFK